METVVCQRKGNLMDMWNVIGKREEVQFTWAVTHLHSSSHGRFSRNTIEKTSHHPMGNSRANPTVNATSSHPPPHCHSPSSSYTLHPLTPFLLVDSMIHHANTSERQKERGEGAGWEFKEDRQTLNVTVVVKGEMSDSITSYPDREEKRGETLLFPRPAPSEPSASPLQPARSLGHTNVTRNKVHS